jgi:hypothetical protein
MLLDPGVEGSCLVQVFEPSPSRCNIANPFDEEFLLGYAHTTSGVPAVLEDAFDSVFGFSVFGRDEWFGAVVVLDLGGEGVIGSGAQVLNVKTLLGTSSNIEFIGVTTNNLSNRLEDVLIGKLL